MLIGGKGLVCGILSLEWSTNVILISEVSGLELCAFGCPFIDLVTSVGSCVGGLGHAVLLVRLGVVHQFPNLCLWRQRF